MPVNRIDQTPVTAAANNTPATSATPSGDNFSSRLNSSAVTSSSMAGTFVPGGAVVSAAISSSPRAGLSSNAGVVGAWVATGMGGASVPATGGTGTALGGTSTAGTGVPVSTGTDAQAAGFGSVLNQQAAMNMQYLQLQNQMQQENQTFSTLSNVLKVRHETANNSISNIH